MAISEDQLETWSYQGSVQQSAATYQTNKTVLESFQAPYANRNFNIFVQGSYGNTTNIWAEGDVDIAICLTSVFSSDIDELSPVEKKRYEQNRFPAEYSIEQFKEEVTSWLHQNFGNEVTPGNKAIAVPGSNRRRDADVLACAEHRRYFPTLRWAVRDSTKVGEVQMHLFAEPPLRSDAEAIPHQQHADQQLRIDSRTTLVAVELRKMRPNTAQID